MTVLYCLGDSIPRMASGELYCNTRKEIIMPVMNELEMNKGQQLSEEQINRIVEALKRLSERTYNAQAITLYHNVKNSKNLEEKRKWIVLFYTYCFQLLSFINMARDKDIPLPDFIVELDKLFKSVAHNGK